MADRTDVSQPVGVTGETCGLTIDCEAPLICNGVCGVCTGTEDDSTTDLDDCASVTAMPGITDASFQGAKELSGSAATITRMPSPLGLWTR